MNTMRLLCGLGMCLIAGCGSNEIPLVPVSGKLTMNGKPVAFKNVRFVPEPGTPGMGAGGNTNAEGEYKLLAVRGGSTIDQYGVPAGKYKVVVTEPVFPINDVPAALPPAAGDAPVAAIGPPVAKPVKKSEALPPRYAKAETTTLNVDVSPPEAKIDLEMTKN
jgi:hypothetical protein